MHSPAVIKGNMKLCLSEYAIRIYLTWSCRYCPVCTLSPINLVSLVKVWTIKHYTECVSHTINTFMHKVTLPSYEIFFLSLLLSWNLNWEKGCKHVGLGSLIQTTLRPITVRNPLYFKKQMKQNHSCPQKPDPNCFLCPTRQKLCSSWNMEPRVKALSTGRRGNLVWIQP